MPKLQILARWIAVLGLIAGLFGPTVPSVAVAAPMTTSAAVSAPVHAGMHCDDAGEPAPHAPGAIDCCVASLCAMGVALPNSAAIPAPAYPEAPGYRLNAWPQPIDFDAAPIPHPPKPL